MLRKALAILPLSAAAVLVSASPAAADHTHFRVVGNGECVLLAPQGGEKYVQLPRAVEFDANRQHPLHVNVHLGRPGQVGEIFVAYTADGTLTGEAEQRCNGEFLNR